MFLLLKSDETADGDDPFVEAATTSMVQFHPVMKRLQQWNVLLQKLKSKVEDKVDSLDEQLDNLIKASKMMSSMAEESDEGNGSERNDDKDEASDIEDQAVGDGEAVPAAVAFSESEASSEDEEAISRQYINDARFGLRPNEIARDRSAASKRKRRAVPSDFGDGEAAGDNKTASRYLSSAINTIEQRAASKKKKRKDTTEDLVDHQDGDDALRRGLEMMEAELGKDFDKEGDVAGDDGDEIASIGSEDDGGDFYKKMAKTSKHKRELKKSLYKVAPKYPRLEGEVEGKSITLFLRALGLHSIANNFSRKPNFVTSLFCRRTWNHACYNEEQRSGTS